MDRRAFLKSACAVTAAGILLPLEAMAGTNEEDAYFWSLPRSLYLKRAQTGETIETVYWRDGALVADGYAKICWLLRDVTEKVHTYMDPRLFDLMRAVQSHVKYYGYTSPLVINSGYRTPRTNGKLEGSAKNSLHMRGLAVDFVMPGLPSNYMGVLASHYKAGGVGFYPDNGFTHLDVGNVRYWLKKKGWNVLPPRSR